MRTPRWSTRGFTLFDLLAVLVIILLLVSLLLPAVQAARESARRAQCQNNLIQIGIALVNYQQTYRVLPPGSVSATQTVSWLQPPSGIGWIPQILPQLGEETTWLQINSDDPFASFPQNPADPAAQNQSDSIRAMADPAAPEQRKMIPYPSMTTLRCPSSTVSARVTLGANNYAGCHHSTEQPISENGDGMFSVNSSESLDHIPDGRSNTLLVGEHSNGLNGHGWVVGDRSSLRNGDTLDPPAPQGVMIDYSQQAARENGQSDPATQQLLSQQVGTFGSQHPYHVNFLLADGSVRPLSKKIDSKLLRNLIARADGNPLSDAGF